MPWGTTPISTITLEVGDVDKDAKFFFVPGDQLEAEAKRLGAIPFDVPGIELGHHGQ